MSIEHKKQQEIQLLLKDAFEIKKQMQAILEQTALVSEKFSQVGDGIVNLSKNISKISEQFGKSGSSITAGAEIIGKAIKFGGQFWAKHKENKLKKEMLPKKQAIANAKIGVIKKLRERVLKEHAQIEIYFKQESKKISDVTNEEKYKLLEKGLKELLDTYFIFKHLLYMSDFFLAEFEAWLANLHESKAVLLPATEIYKKCVHELIENSSFPKNDDLHKKVSLGTLQLLSNEKTKNYALQFPSVTEYCELMSQKRVKSIFLFFTKKSREFNQFYTKYLKQNDYIRYSTVFRILTPILLLLLLVGGAVGFYFWFDKNYYLAAVGFGVGLLTFFIFNRYVLKYLSDIKNSAKHKIAGYSQANNKKILRKFQTLRIRDFILSIIIDAIGMITYLFPGLGEVFDAVWAPISGILIFLIYKGRIGVGIAGALFAMGEEAIPGTDFIPTGLIMWAEKYFVSKKKTLEKMEYISNEKMEN